MISHFFNRLHRHYRRSAQNAACHFSFKDGSFESKVSYLGKIYIYLKKKSAVWDVKPLMFNIWELYLTQIRPDCYKLPIHPTDSQLINMINESTLATRTGAHAVHTAQCHWLPMRSAACVGECDIWRRGCTFCDGNQWGALVAKLHVSLQSVCVCECVRPESAARERVFLCGAACCDLSFETTVKSSDSSSVNQNVLTLKPAGHCHWDLQFTVAGLR